MKLYNFETEFLTTVTNVGRQMDLSQWHRQWNTFVEKELWVSLPWGWSEQFPKSYNGFLILNHIYLHTNWDSYNANKEECDCGGSSHFLQERLASAQLSERKQENVIHFKVAVYLGFETHLVLLEHFQIGSTAKYDSDARTDPTLQNDRLLNSCIGDIWPRTIYQSWQRICYQHSAHFGLR